MQIAGYDLLAGGICSLSSVGITTAIRDVPILGLVAHRCETGGMLCVRRSGSHDKAV